MQTIHFSRTLATAVSVYAVLLMPSSVSAQISPANRSALVAKGYSQADFKAAEMTQIGSNYLFYSEWMKCSRQISQIIIMNDITDSRVGIAFSQCNDKALALRAALARTMSLDQATRAVSLLATDIGMETGQLQNARRARQAVQARSDSPFWQEGQWTVVANTEGICAGAKTTGGRNGDSRSTLSMMISPHDGGYQLRLIIDNTRDMPGYKSILGKSFSLTSVTSEDSFQAGSMRTFFKKTTPFLQTITTYFLLSICWIHCLLM